MIRQEQAEVKSLHGIELLALCGYSSEMCPEEDVGAVPLFMVISAVRGIVWLI